MKTREITPKQYHLLFRTEKQCMKYLFSVKYPDGFVCRRCGHEHYTEITTRHVWQCKVCRYQDSAKAGTLFHKSKVSLVDWFQAVYEFTVARGGIAATELMERLGLGSYRTAWLMLHKLRIAMYRRDENYKLNDESKEEWIELDGAVFGKRAKGTESNAYIAVKGRKCKDGKIRMCFVKAEQVKTFSKDELCPFLEKNTEVLTYVKTDGGLDIEKAKEGSTAAITQKVMGGDKKRQDAWLPLVHRFISNIKSSLRGVYHGVSPKHLDKYLSEHAYRTNRLLWRREIQFRLLNACVTGGPSNWAEVCT